MENSLDNLITLIGNSAVKKESDTIIVELDINKENSDLLCEFYEEDLIENITNTQNKIVTVEQIQNFDSELLIVEFVIAELKRKRFYIDFNDFISDNRFQIPDDYYILELNLSNTSEVLNERLEKYKLVVKLINELSTKAKFISDDDFKTLYLIQENSFLEFPIDNIVYEDCLNSDSIHLVKDYIESIVSYKEKRSIFLKELIDFLTEEKKIDRFQYLLSNFKEFFERCNTSFEYYLSNFSFNKVKLELDNSVIEFSKNIRSIINDSQSKLIAIPAAFVLASSQLDLNNAISIKNILIVVSSFMFSYIISLFINNQRNALEIISDNVENFKKSFNRSKRTTFEEEKELRSLFELIKKSYIKIDIELQKQKKRLSILQVFNWGVSVTIFLILILSKYYSDIWQILKTFINWKWTS